MPEHVHAEPSVTYVYQDNARKERYIEVLVPRHVRQFLLMEYAGNADHIKASQNQFIGAMVVSVCEKIPYRRVRSRKKFKGSKVRIVLPYDAEYSHVSLQTLNDLTVILEKLFFEKMRSFVTCGYYVHTSERNAVDLFLQVYDINPDDWDLDAAYACWKRYKSDVGLVERKEAPPRYIDKKQK
ncbi:hypothetical protein [Runella salmonicolor]|uniref:Uncharacterized protein n=1 Tax=Runella salmonicolor TaxID=2950278 RepID=A0ABT1FRS4_9BACT|nr:hypothetical protein [Runella salmonicolor]MCP1384466.1 hypothetical protein [Runella salmonicolor]